MRREAQRTGIFTRRALLLMGGQAAVLGTLATRLYQVQVEDGARYTTMADDNRISARMIAPPRGRMLDRFGVVVAGSSTNWRAVLIAEQATNVAATLDAFSALLPLNEYERARIDRELHRKRRFIPVTIREFLTWDEMATIEVNAPDLPDCRRCRHHPAVPVRGPTSPYRRLRRPAERGRRGG
jgi:penicillin-binding protein 2